MTKTHIVETVEEFDENGKLLMRTVTETDETTDEQICHTHTIFPGSLVDFEKHSTGG